MNFSIIRYILFRVLEFAALFLTLPCLVALIYQEEAGFAFAAVMIGCFLVAEISTAMISTSTPMPPIQCAKSLQNCTLLDRYSTSGKILQPVVVSPGFGRTFFFYNGDRRVRRSQYEHRQLYDGGTDHIYGIYDTWRYEL